MKKFILCLCITTLCLNSCQNIDDSGIIAKSTSKILTIAELGEKLAQWPNEDNVLLVHSNTVALQDKLDYVNEIAYSNEKVRKTLFNTDNKLANALKDPKLTSKIFGNNLGIEPGQQISALGTGNDDYYIPDGLEAHYSTNGSEVLTPGTVLNWNIDLENKKGLLLYIEYNPNLQLNEKLKLENPESITEYVIFDEKDGSFTFHESLLSTFPKGAIVTTALLRAGTNKITEEIGLVGISSIEDIFVVNY